MKILFKSARFRGGSARSLLEYAKIFRARGDEVVFAARHMSELRALFEESGITTPDAAAFSNINPEDRCPQCNAPLLMGAEELQLDGCRVCGYKDKEQDEFNPVCPECGGALGLHGRCSECGANMFEYDLSPNEVQY